jgi:hypothetical protein
VDQVAILVTAPTGPGVLHQLTGVIARHGGDISSVEILSDWEGLSRTYLEISVEDTDTLVAELRALEIVRGLEVASPSAPFRKPTVTTSAARRSRSTRSRSSANRRWPRPCAPSPASPAPRRWSSPAR